MPVRNDGYPRITEPSCFDKIKMGFLIGCMVGLGSGALFGTYNSFRVGFRGAELIRHTSKSMLSGGATFGTFMAIGSGIRC